MGSRVGDMQSLNLFGLPLDLESRDTGKQNREMQKVIQDLLQQALQNDPTGSSRDFSTRKAASFFDPYNEEA